MTAPTAPAADAADPDDDRGFVPPTAAERESFLDAVARHRRAAWRVTAACAACVVALAAVVSLLMAPVAWVAAGLVLDLLNLVVPMPDLLGASFAALEPVLDDPLAAPAALARLVGWAMAPGLVMMLLVVLALNRMLNASRWFGAGDLDARALDRSVPAERRLANVFDEMAIAAGVPAPRVWVSRREVANAALFARDDAHATVVVTEALIARLDRRQLQGVAAHLIASLADGDTRIGLRVAVVLAVFGLVGRLGTSLLDRGATIGLIVRLLRGALRPGSVATHRVMEELLDPMGPPGGADAPAVALAARRYQQATGQSVEIAAPRDDGVPLPGAVRAGATPDRLTWREWAVMPLMGPVAMAGFIAAIVATFLLGPLLSLAWRRRKLMADATAVRLTRDADGLAAALNDLGGGGTLSPWAMHLAVTAPVRMGGNLLSSPVVPMLPSVDRRIRALRRLGASVVSKHAVRSTSPLVWLLIGPLFALVAVLMATAVVLMAWVSVMLTVLFLLLPAGALHALLRWAAG